MDGISDATALLFIAFFGDFSKFNSPKQLTKFIGLNLWSYKSGDGVKNQYKTFKISKIGRKDIRSFLYFVVMGLVQRDMNFKQFYERKKENSPGKGCKKRALIACMDKLLRTVFYLVKQDFVYNKQFNLVTV